MTPANAVTRFTIGRACTLFCPSGRTTSVGSYSRHRGSARSAPVGLADTRRVSESELVFGTPCAALQPGVMRYNGFRLDLPQPRRRVELPVPTATLVIV